MSDLNTLYRNTEPWIAAAAYSKYGHPVAIVNCSTSCRLCTRAHALTAPLLLVHGGQRHQRAGQRIAADVRGLAGAGPHRASYLLFADDGHEIDKRENRAVLVKAMCDWLTSAFARADS